MSSSDTRSNAFSAKKLEYLQLRLKREGIGIAGEQTIPRRDATDPCPLSFAQQRLWFLEQFEPGTPTYTIPSAMRLKGALDVNALEQSIQEIIRRHEALRTIFAQTENGPVQLVTPAYSVLTRIDLQGLSASEQEIEVRRLADEEAKRPFDLSSGPLIRWRLLMLRAEEHVLLFTVHHIAADGWSIAILIREISLLYTAFRADQPSPLPPLPIQYADYALWQRRWLHGPLLEEHLGYWRERLAALPTLALPTDHPRPLVQSYRGATVSFSLSATLTHRLKRLSQQRGVTLFMTLLAAFQVLLARLSGQEDMVVGSPIANRRQREVEGLIGFFGNMLVLRSDLSGNPPFARLLERVREGCLEAYAHQDLPFEKLVELLQPARDLNRHPLFQVLFGFQPALPTSQAATELQIEPLAVEMGIAKFDLSLLFQEQATNQALIGTFEYSVELFERETIQRLSEHFTRLLEGIVTNVDCPIQALPLLGDAEREQLLHTWNATRVTYPPAVALHELVEEQARRTPDAVALVCGEQQMSYAVLEARANQLAHLLRQQGVGPEGLVGLHFERSLDLVLCLLAVLKAGGAYVPLDPDYPPERLRFMIQDARLRLILTREVPGWMGQEQVRWLSPERAWRPGEFPTTPCPGAAASTQLVYVIYTSGSTGQPKGAMNQHGSLCNRLQWMQEAYPLARTDRVLQKTPMSFDVSVWEFFWPLCYGACLVMAPPGAHQDPRSLVQLLSQYDITVLHFVPSMLRAFLETPGAETCGSLKQVICSGEALSTDLQERFFALYRTPLHNLYGPTEAAIDVTAWTCVPGWKRPSVPIGRPIANTEIYILDALWQPVPVGVVGELYMGGAGLARGYWGRPALSAERFVPDPFSGRPGARLYRSGDLARYLPDGTLEFVGRVDSQVKLRGYRIELGEIEAVLGAQPEIAEAAVVLREEEGSDPHLVAYLVPSSSQEGTSQSSLSLRELRSRLSQWLPAYMQPASLVLLERLPLTPNGKLDRRSLPPPDRASPSGRERTYVAPRSPLEEILVELWQEVLNVEQIGIEDNFFELGGHSLLATQLASRLRGVLLREVPLRLLFVHLTIAELAGALEPILRDGDHAASVLIPLLMPQKRPATVPLSFAQERLWFLAQLVPDNPFYNIPLALRLRGDLRKAALYRSICELVARHETLRTTFPARQGSPVQLVAASLSVDLPVIDLQDLDAAQREVEVQRLGTQEALRPFDLTRTPPFRVVLVRLAPQEHLLLLTLHHIAADGWSLHVLAADLSALYTAFRAGQPSPLPPLPIQYADYALWQRRWLHGPLLEEHLGYWRERLAALPTLALPTDHPRPPVQSYRGATVSFSLSATLTHRLKRLSQQQGTTLFMTLLAAFQVLLAHFSGQEDIVVGSPIANRRQRELEGLIGFFVNMLVLRSDLSGNPPFSRLLERVRETCLQAYAHQDLPFEKLVELLQPTRELNRHPLFQVSFQLLQAQQGPETFLSLPRLDLLTERIEGRVARFDLEFDLYEAHQGIEGNLLYSTDLFEQASIVRLLQHWRTMLEAIAVNPEQRIWQIPLLTPSEEKQLLSEWNQALVPLPQDRCLHELIEEQARRTPDAVALVCGEQQMSYAVLEARANQLAHLLRQQGVGPEMLVGVYLERSLDLVLCLLAVLKAGGAYVPLDPDYPPERLRFMIQDAHLEVIVGQQAPQWLLQEQVRWLMPQQAWREAGAFPVTPCQVPTDPAQLAYIIYTSGSTGTPKGAMIPHRAIVNHMYWMQRTFQFRAEDRVLQKTSFSFDASVWEFYAPLLIGGCLVMARSGGQFDPTYLIDTVLQQNITTLQVVPTMLRALLSEPGIAACRMLTRVFSGGEELAIGLQRQFFETASASLYNLYGPTECAIDSAGWTCEREEPRPYVPLGRPIHNMQIYVLDGCLRPVPPGVIGELYIGGEGVGRGYYRRPEITAEKFLPNPFGRRPGDRMYRSGDLGRYRLDGTLEFVGRVDSQVKLRGYRIELGEIEAVLGAQPEIAEAAVVLREEEGSDPHLVAYLVPASTEPFASPKNEQAPRSMYWQTVFEETYRHPQSSQVQDPTFNIAGWLSSYTRQPLSAEEMGEWVEQTVERIAALRPQRILEVGCGTGLLLFRLAPGAQTYWATDFSAQAIQDLRDSLDRRVPPLVQVRLEQRTADDWTGLPSAFFDLVILNSVVQYFPSLDYLVHVLEQAVQSLREGGRIFVGDVRSLPLLEAFHTSVVLHQAADTMRVEQIQELVRQRMQQEDELVIDPRFFSWLPQRLPRIRRVQVSPRRGRAPNELTRYRYDVILDVEAVQASGADQVSSGKSEGAETPDGIVWQEASGLQQIAQMLERQRPLYAGLACVPNRRVHAAVRACEILRTADPAQRLLDVLSAAREPEADEPGIDPEELWMLGQRLGYRVEISWLRHDRTGAYDVLFVREPGQAGQGPAGGQEAGRWSFPQDTRVSSSWREYSTRPWQAQERRSLVPRLRRRLGEQLPAYMLPAAYVLLDRLPLTPNGKLDRRALPPPAPDWHTPAKAYVAPRDPQEEVLAGLWQEALGVERIGADDNFFELGGHSLMAIQVVARARHAGLPLTLSLLFQYPVLADVAARMREVLHSRTSEDSSATPLSQKHRALVSLRPSDSRRPFFCIPPIPGEPRCYAALARALDYPSYGLRAAGLQGERDPFATIEEMAAYYIEAIRTLDAAGPYALVGWSFGGLVAFEMALQLQRQGAEVALLALIDTFAPPFNRQGLTQEDAAQISRFLSENLLQCLDQLPEHERVQPIQMQTLRDLPRLAQVRYLRELAELAGVGEFIRVGHASFLALEHYQPQGIYEGRLLLLRAGVSGPGDMADSAYGWQQLASRPVDVRVVPGTHSTLISEPDVSTLARCLRPYLEE